MKDVLEYESVKNWLIGYSARTKVAYPFMLNRFCNYAHKTPDELLDESRQNVTHMHYRLKQFYEYLGEKGQGSSARFHAYMSIRSFLKHNDIFLGKVPNFFRPRVAWEKKHLLSRQEIFDMIGCCWSIRNKAIISFLAQSGQRVSVLCAMRYGQVRRELESGINPIVINVNSGMYDFDGFSANKGKLTYQFAIGREAAGYLRQIIKQRRSRGETIDDDSWLFRSRVTRVSNKKGEVCMPRIQPDKPGSPLSVQAVYFILNGAATAAGIQSRQTTGMKSNGRPVVVCEIHSHIFRMYWKTSMRKGGVTDPDLLSYMMGQNIGYRMTYDRFDADCVRSAYAKAEPQLTVMPFTTEGTGLPPNQSVLPGYPRPTQPTIPGGQRIVTEPELEALFSSGWRYIATLPSGKIIVESLNPN